MHVYCLGEMLRVLDLGSVPVAAVTGTHRPALLAGPWLVTARQGLWWLGGLCSSCLQGQPGSVSQLHEEWGRGRGPSASQACAPHSMLLSGLGLSLQEVRGEPFCSESLSQIHRDRQSLTRESPRSWELVAQSCVKAGGGTASVVGPTWAQPAGGPCLGAGDGSSSWRPQRRAACFCGGTPWCRPL